MGAVLIVAAVLLSATGGAATAATSTTGTQAQTEAVSPPAFVVALAEDGSADVTVTYTFDLTDDARKAAFEELRTNETAAESFEDRFRTQLQGVAGDTSDVTGREMSITDVNIAFEADGDTGVARLTATWEGLARIDGDQLTVSEPFASGYEPERRFVVTLPDGYAVEGVTPGPAEQTDGRLGWSVGTDLSGFELTASPTGEDGTASGDDAGDGSDDTGGDSADGSDTATQTAGESGPGFGAVLAALAVLAAALAALRRW